MPFGGSGRYLGQFEPKLSQLESDTDLWWVVPFSVRYIVGVSGFRFAGKSTVQAYLGEKHGFRVYSLARAVRRVAEEQGIPLSPRRNLQELGDEMRAERGDAGYLARSTLRAIRADHLGRPGQARIVVGGFKHPAEVEVFNRLDVFHFWRIQADDSVRLERAKRTGMLYRELSELGVSSDEEDSDLFNRYLDGPDRAGRDANTWTAGYGQWVDGVVDAGEPDRQAEIPNDADDYRPLFDELDERVKVLDAAHRRPRL